MSLPSLKRVTLDSLLWRNRASADKAKTLPQNRVHHQAKNICGIEEFSSVWLDGDISVKKKRKNDGKTDVLAGASCH